MDALLQRIKEFRADETVDVDSLDEQTKGSARDAAGLLAFVAKNPKKDTTEEDLKSVREFLQFASKSSIAAFLTFFWKNML